MWLEPIEAKLGTLRYVMRGDEKVLQRYEWRGRPNGSIGWFDVPVIPVVEDESCAG